MGKMLQELPRYEKKVKLRQLTQNNKTGDSHGVTIPKRIAEKYKGTTFNCYESGTGIYLESGAWPSSF